MKKTLKITGIVIGALLLLLIVLPIAFKGKIKDIVIAQGNKMLNAEFNFESLDLSLIRNFPNATVTLNELDLWGKGDFAQDTLLSAGKVSATVDIMSIFGDDGIKVLRVLVKDTYLKAIVLEDGRPNWDIMLPSDEKDDDAEDDEQTDFALHLKKLTLENVNAVYDDRQGKMYAAAENIGMVLSGDMTADRTMLKLKTEIEKVNFRYGGVPYANNVKLKADMDIDADLENMKFELKDNVLSINAITAGIDGTVAMPEDEVIDLDLSLKTEKVGFKEILSLIPAIYMKEFKDLQADGAVTLAAWAKGRMAGDDLPAFEASLKVDNGSFRYPSLPMGVDNINIAAMAKNAGGSVDNTVVDISRLSLSMAGSPFAATLHLSTPISDPNFAATAKGVLNLGKIKDVYPLEDMELNGVLNADLDLKGRMSYIEKEQYDKFAASGSLQVSDMLVKMKDMPDVTIHKSTFTFTPQYLNLSETTVGIGRSDITTDCRLSNYIGFALKGQTIKGHLNVRSNLLDLNEMMGSGTETTGEATPAAESSATGAFKVPSNIDFDMNTALGKVLFDNIELDNVKGQIVIRNSKLDMKNLSFNTLEGSVVANGYYSTADGVASPALNAAFGMKDLSFRKTFETFNTVQKLVPIFEGLHGNFSGNLSINTRMDSLMNVRYNTMNGEGAINTRNLNLSGVEAIDKIADAVNYQQLKNINVKDINIHFTIKEGRVHTKPFDIKMGDMNMNLSGSTGIDQTIDYSGKLKLPESIGISKYTSVDLKIGGTFSSPKVSLDTKSMINQAAQQAGQEALTQLGNKLGIDLGDAEKQRAALIEQAQKAGDKLVEEAQKQADKLVAEAGDKTLARVAAEAAGKKLVDAAKKQSDSLVAKATAEGDKLVEKAKAGEPAE